MSITKRQFHLLQAMGIEVWQRKALTEAQPYPSNTEQTLPAQAQEVEPSNVCIPIDIRQLNESTIFHDIVRSFGISFAEIKVTDNTIDLGLINWQFCQNNKIALQNNCLVTPPLHELAHSSSLKRELWQSIGHLIQ